MPQSRLKVRAQGQLAERSWPGQGWMWRRHGDEQALLLFQITLAVVVGTSQHPDILPEVCAQQQLARGARAAAQGGQERWGLGRAEVAHRAAQPEDAEVGAGVAAAHRRNTLQILGLDQLHLRRRERAGKWEAWFMRPGCRPPRRPPQQGDSQPQPRQPQQSPRLLPRQLRHQALQAAPRLPQRLLRAVNTAEAHRAGAVPAHRRRKQHRGFGAVAAAELDEDPAGGQRRRDVVRVLPQEGQLGAVRVVLLQGRDLLVQLAAAVVIQKPGQRGAAVEVEQSSGGGPHSCVVAVQPLAISPHAHGSPCSPARQVLGRAAETLGEVSRRHLPLPLCRWCLLACQAQAAAAGSWWLPWPWLRVL